MKPGVLPRLEVLGLSGNPIYDPVETVQSWQVMSPEPEGETPRLLRAERMKELPSSPPR